MDNVGEDHPLSRAAKKRGVTPESIRKALVKRGMGAPWGEKTDAEIDRALEQSPTEPTRRKIAKSKPKHKTDRRYSEAERARILAYYAGHSTKETLAKFPGLSTYSIWNWQHASKKARGPRPRRTNGMKGTENIGLSSSVYLRANRIYKTLATMAVGEMEETQEEMWRLVRELLDR